MTIHKEHATDAKLTSRSSSTCTHSRAEGWSSAMATGGTTWRPDHLVCGGWAVEGGRAFRLHRLEILLQNQPDELKDPHLKRFNPRKIDGDTPRSHIEKIRFDSETAATTAQFTLSNFLWRAPESGKRSSVIQMLRRNEADCSTRWRHSRPSAQTSPSRPSSLRRAVPRWAEIGRIVRERNAHGKGPQGPIERDDPKSETIWEATGEHETAFERGTRPSHPTSSVIARLRRQ